MNGVRCVSRRHGNLTDALKRLLASVFRHAEVPENVFGRILNHKHAAPVCFRIEKVYLVVENGAQAGKNLRIG